MTELKPCPFCGGEAEVRGTYRTIYVCCLWCGAESGEYSDVGQAIRAWNRRVEWESE